MDGKTVRIRGVETIAHIKGKLMAIENRKRPAEGEKSNRPSLKRRTSGETEDTSEEPTQKDDDRPTLKRRTN